MDLKAFMRDGDNYYGYNEEFLEIEWSC